MPGVKFLTLADLKKRQEQYISALKSRVSAEEQEAAQRQELLDSLEEFIHTQVELVVTYCYYITPGCKPTRYPPRTADDEMKLQGVVKSIGLDGDQEVSDQPTSYLDLIVDGFLGTWRVLLPNIKSIEVFTTKRAWIDLPDHKPWPREVVRHKQAESSAA